MPQFNLSEIDFDDLSPIEIPVKIGGTRYVLREASVDAAVRYRNVTMKAARMVDGKVASMENLHDAEPLLVSLCLCQVDGQGNIRKGTNGNPVTVPESTVRSWPYRVSKSLFDRILEISPSLKEEETQQALEKQFKDLCEKLVHFSESDKDRTQWAEFLHGAVSEALKVVPDGDGELLPNGRLSATTTSSV